MKAISIKQPWAWLIVNGHKDIENRTWATKHRGPILIHASKKIDMAAYWKYAEEYDLPDYRLMEVGGIVGGAVITSVVTESTSPWFQGPKGFNLAGQMRLPFVPYKGKLNIFEVVLDDNFKEAMCQNNIKSQM